MAIIKYRDALREALREEMTRDPLVFIMGENIGERGGSYKVTEGLIKQFGKDRVMDTPIAEPGFTGMAVGAAILGCRPIAEILFVDFTFLIMDQMMNQAAKFKFMSGLQGKVPMVLRTQGGCWGQLAGHHSQSLEGMFYQIPGLKVVMPATPYDAKGLLKSAIRDDDPVVFIEHKLLYINDGEVPEEEYLVPLGKADVKRQGSDVTIVAYSLMVQKSLQAAEKLAQEGIDVEVVDLRTLVPLDKETILKSVNKTGKLVIVQEAVKRGGIAGDIAATVMEEAFDNLDAPILRVAGLNTTIPFNPVLEQACIPQVDDIVKTVRKVMGK